ncbi:hypothetical protein QQS21_007399 [Conoideocrella luteorostrata]|uniref:Terpenoid synthase n=1 Tax=Conoideocrella luteorostrata TaxID=1105319 RepID=A0AAJ0FZI2_9HYPO|nr:hypothetical protein QQS21_007399 [Conoideocrella luteorostrata]
MATTSPQQTSAAIAPRHPLRMHPRFETLKQSAYEWYAGWKGDSFIAQGGGDSDIVMTGLLAAYICPDGSFDKVRAMVIYCAFLSAFDREVDGAEDLKRASHLCSTFMGIIDGKDPEDKRFSPLTSLWCRNDWTHDQRQAFRRGARRYIENVEILVEAELYQKALSFEDYIAIRQCDVGFDHLFSLILYACGHDHFWERYESFSSAYEYLGKYIGVSSDLKLFKGGRQQKKSHMNAVEILHTSNGCSYNEAMDLVAQKAVLYEQKLEDELTLLEREFPEIVARFKYAISGTMYWMDYVRQSRYLQMSGN